MSFGVALCQYEIWISKVHGQPLNFCSLRAASFAERLRLGLAVIHGEPKDMAETEDDDGRNSPPPPDKDSKDMGITPSKSGRLETNM